MVFEMHTNIKGGGILGTSLKRSFGEKVCRRVGLDGYAETKGDRLGRTLILLGLFLHNGA